MEEKEKDLSLMRLVIDTKNDYKDISKTITGILIISLVLNILLAGIFFINYDRQRNQFLDTLEKQQIEFTNLLSGYEFETITTTIDGTQDGTGINIMGNDISALPE